MRFLKTKILVKHAYTTSAMELRVNIKTIKVFVSCASMLLTIKSLLLGFFFATSHGKSPCDGIGGTIKHLVARASLQD